MSVLGGGGPPSETPQTRISVAKNGQIPSRLPVQKAAVKVELWTHLFK